MSMFRTLLVLLLILPSTVMARAALDQPNIVVIFLDDSGYADFAPFGTPSVKTPNLSALVREGARVPQFYSASAVCSVSRYGLLTGRNPARSGLSSAALDPSGADHIDTREVTLAEGLKAVGYTTAIFGKWHLGTPNAANGQSQDAFPLAHGFDRWLGTNVSHDYTVGANLVRAPSTVNTPIAGYETVEPEIALKSDVLEALSTRYTDAAVEFINENRDRPFLAYLAYNMPHLPVYVPPAFKGRSSRGLYGDAIEELDHHIGRIRSALEANGIAKNTLLVFTSDNGPWLLYQDIPIDPRYGEARFLVGSAKPLRDGKASNWEGGVRVPGVFWWPGVIAPATWIREPVSALDLVPTAFALAGGALPTDRIIDGRNIAPYLSPKNFSGPVNEFTYIYNGGTVSGAYGIRRGPWKLLLKTESQTLKNYGYSASESSPLLFNLEKDPYERVNVAQNHPQQVQALKAALTAFKTSLGNQSQAAQTTAVHD